MHHPHMGLGLGYNPEGITLRKDHRSFFIFRHSIPDGSLHPNTSVGVSLYDGPHPSTMN